MRANLSLVLDRDGMVKLDLLKDKTLSEIDKYTTLFLSSKELREKYSDTINAYLESMSEYTSNFKSEQAKRGRIVITYTDEKNNSHCLRVFYNENKDKINLDEMLRKIRKDLDKEGSFNKSLALVNHFSNFIFGSEFDRREIRRLKLKYSSDPKKYESVCNKSLIKKIIYDHLELYSVRNYEKGYFFVRLIDSYIDKNKIGVLDKKKVNNLDVREVYSPVKLNKITSNETIKDGNFYMESDGQYNLFSTKQQEIINKPLSYEDYFEQENERMLFK